MTYSSVQNGWIGNLITGAIYTDDPTIIYVTLESGMVQQVLNIRVDVVLGTPITIGYDSNALPNTLQVLGLWYKSETKNVDPHHTQHEWPNPDAVFVKGEQFYPKLFYPVTGTMTVNVFPGSYKLSSGWKTQSVATTIDFTSSIPSTSGNACYAVLVMSQTGDFAIRKGTEIASYSNLADANLPELISGDSPIFAVKLFSGQTELRKNNQNNDFVDLRFLNLLSSGLSTSTLQTLISGLTEKSSVADNDVFSILDTAASYILKKLTFSNIKSTLKTYFDPLYAAVSHAHSGNDITSGTIDGDRLPAISQTKQGAVPLTGIPSGKYLKDDGSWAAVASGGASVADLSSSTEVLGGSAANGSDVTASRSDHKHAITNPALDTLATPTDITNLNATTGRHGLLPKLDGSALKYLDGSGGWSVPAASSSANSKITATGGTITDITGYRVHKFTSGGTFQITAGNDYVEYLIVGGGGGGGRGEGNPGGDGGGGGGAGGVLRGRILLPVGSYAIVVGNGGAGSTSQTANGVSGGNSSFGDLGLIAIGGGGGGSDSDGTANAGAVGGCGGGAANNYGGSWRGGGAMAGQGFPGGNAVFSSTTWRGGAGGGGAGSSGIDRGSAAGGYGGVGTPLDITGTTVVYSAGGNGGTSGSGGAGANGSANSGNGGGGGGGDGSGNFGGSGGSGVVILRYKI